MLHYTRLQLMTVVTVPMVTIVLIWTVVIFHRNRKRWRCYDVATVAILIQSVLRNFSVVTYTILQMLDQDAIDFDYCSVFVWTFNSLHTFQASTLTTLAVIVLFSVKLHRKGEQVKNYLTAAHVVYHLFCLTVLCACVGVAAILAKQAGADFAADYAYFPANLCKFMPYEMDVKYNVFVTTLHIFLVCVSSVCCVFACYHYCLTRGAVGFDYSKKSNSDLSELSLTKNDDSKSYYDVDRKIEGVPAARRFTNNREAPWNSDTSNISTTVSSTNSRRPCINARNCEEREYEGDDGVGFESVLPILTVCYLFSHVPIIILCLFPRLLSPWSVASAALCLGLLQDILVPLSLGLVDTRFCHWVSTVYHCSERRRQNDKLPQVGLDGKFRPFCSQTPTVEVLPTVPQRQRVTYQPSTEPKFPITNGSLYTSIDGRLPVIHNYRRHKDRGVKQSESNLINLDAHATYLKQQEQHNDMKIPKVDFSCSTCQTNTQKEFPTHRATSIDPIKVNDDATNPAINKPVAQNVGTSNEDNLRSNSEVSLYELDSFDGTTRPGLTGTDSEEDYFTDSMNPDDNANKTFDSLSSQSSYSITTEANGDFDFYQMNDDVEDDNNNIDFVTAHRHETFDYLRYRSTDDVLEYAPPKILQTFKPHLSTDNAGKLPVVAENAALKTMIDLNHNFRIKRSNSKRSLESFKAYVNDNEFYGNSMQRSYSYVDLDESKGSNQSELQRVTCDGGRRAAGSGGSVPDLKKIFISEYL